MPVRGSKNPFPAVKAATNSGIFSGGKGGRQKMDAAPKLSAGVRRAKTEAFRTDCRVKPR